MNIFDIINEVAVLGTTFLLMAVSIVWYSNMLFGKFFSVHEKAMLSQDTLSASQKTSVTIVTFACYFILLSGISYAIAVAPLLSVTSANMALFVAAFGSALFTLPLVALHHTFRFILVNIGFVITFVCVGAFVINYWPW